MSAKEWDQCDNVEPMLDYLSKNNASVRKLRLFAVVCCRRITTQLDDRRVEVVDVYEQYADGEVKQEELLALVESIPRTNSSVSPSAELCCYWGWNPESTPSKNAIFAAAYSADTLAEKDPENGKSHLRSTPTWKRERTWQASLAREVFGNPFRPVTVSPAWQTTNVVSLARAIYDERAYDRMPILGDALEDIGCTNADILNHCRQGKQHVKGCWVVDLVLGKT